MNPLTSDIKLVIFVKWKIEKTFSSLTMRIRFPPRNSSALQLVFAVRLM